jgi:hypothetical protein
MSLMNIAIIGGVVLLMLLLVKMRRDKGAEKAPRAAKAPKGSKGRGRGRRRGKDAPPAPPEPMPLAAAAETVAPDEAPAPGWPGELGEDEWPPAHAPEPVAAWPPEADEPAAHEDAFPEEPGDAPEPVPAPVVAEPVAAHAWADDEIVTDPGWPLPGEVDVAWSGGTEEPVVAAAPAWREEAATAAPVEDVEWLGTETAAEPAAEEEIPQWTPPAGEEELPAWQPPADEVPEWEADGSDIPTWQPEEEAEQPTGEFAIPVVGAVEEPAVETPVAEAPAVEEPIFAEPVLEEPTVEEPVFEEPVFDEPVFEEPTVEEPVFEEPVFDESVFEEPVFEEPVFEEPVFEEPVFDEPAFDEPVYEEPAFEEASFEAPVFDEPAFEPVAVATPDAQVEAEAAPVVEAGEPAGPPVAWWDEEDSSEVAGPPVEASSGRWALGGFAAQPGQHALGGVQFRQELDEAPAGWALAPAIDAVPGTLVLVLDGAINCDEGDVEVVTDPGFAPTPQGFTVRVAAKASGPFAASGTFHVLSRD